MALSCALHELINHSNSGPSLETLVEDIQIYVIMHFLRKKDICSFALVSRHCNEVAIPILYSDIDLQQPRTRNSSYHCKDLQFSQCGILGTLEMHPHLASFVRSLRWTFSRNRDHVSSFFRLVLSMKNIQKAHFSSMYPLPCLSDYSDTSGILPVCTSMTLEHWAASLDFAMSVIHPHHLQALVLRSNFQIAIPILKWIPHTSMPHLTSLHIYLDFPTFMYSSLSEELPQLTFACKQALISLRRSLEDVTLGVKEGFGIVLSLVGHGINFLEIATESVPREVLPAFMEEEFPHLRHLQLEGMGGDKASASSKLIEDPRAVMPWVAVYVIPV